MESAVTAENIVHGFKACGVVPFNPEAIPPEAYLPAVPTDTPAPSATVSRPPAAGTELVDGTPDLISTPAPPAMVTCRKSVNEPVTPLVHSPQESSVAESVHIPDTNGPTDNPSSPPTVVAQGNRDMSAALSTAILPLESAISSFTFDDPEI